MGTCNPIERPVNLVVVTELQAISNPSAGKHKAKRFDDIVDDYLNSKKVARFFDRSIHLGIVVERVVGPVVAVVVVDGTRVLPIV